MFSITSDEEDSQPILPKRPASANLAPLPLAAWATVLAVVMSGFLFGYDIGIMSGAIVVLAEQTQNDTQNWGVYQNEYRQEVIVSMTIILAAVGSLASGHLNEWLGRQCTLLIASLIFSSSSLIMAAAPNWAVLTIGRAVAGISIGLLSMTAPPHISEQMPTEWRGPMNVANQLMITVGILTACLVAGSFSYLQGGWRWMLGLGALPALLMSLLLLRTPESIRWLAHNGKEEEAREVLVKLRGTADVEVEWGLILEDVSSRGAGPGGCQLGTMLGCVPVRRALVVGVMLQLFQQFTGINSVIYYADTIIMQAGSLTTSNAIWLGAVVGAVNTAATTAGLLLNLIERYGRKKLLLCSLVGMMVGLALLVLAFYLLEEREEMQPWLIVLGLCVYVAGFAPGMGPLPWALNSEMFPMWCRDTAVSITTTTNWVCNAVVSMTFLTMAQDLGTYQAFGLYMLVCLVAIGYFAMFLPETRGIALERVQDLFKNRLFFTSWIRQDWPVVHDF